MTAQWAGVVMVVLAAIAETLAQVCLKCAGRSVGDADRTFSALGRILAAWRWVVLAIVIYLLESGLYTLALGRLPISYAYPLLSLQLVMLALVSRRWLGESVTPRRWMAIGMILAGVVLVAI